MMEKKLVGMEALLRWQHPQRGVLRPEEFMPIAEDMGVARTLGEWALRQASAQFGFWYGDGHQKIRFATNLSACQLQQNKMYDVLTNLQKKSGIPSSQLVLEVQESSLHQNESKVMSLLRELNNDGFQVSIDDFGTGYSSLARLHDMPIKILKIDRSFVSNIGKKGDEVIRSIIHLAKNLELNVVAEGIETSNQEKFLLANNCPVGQGYYYSKPILQHHMSALLQKEVLS